MSNESKKEDRRKFLSASMIAFLCIFGLLLSAVCARKTPEPGEESAQAPAKKSALPDKMVLQSSIAGTWYPAEAETLRKQVDELFQKAEGKPLNDVIALISPHAGYQYSGQTAVMGIKSIAKEYKRIVVIGPSHRVSMEDVLSVPAATAYQTPLGQLQLDVEFINKLLRYPMFQNVPSAQEYEHSVQIQIPLLQHKIKDFKLVPIVAGHCSPETIARAANILKTLVDEGTLVVASSDFTHYGPNYGYVPFRENIPEQIKNLDIGAYEYIAKLDGKGLLEYRDRTDATICGCVPVAILLSMLGQGTKAELIHYTTSGELAGDYTNSVSYLSVAFCGAWQKSADTGSQPARTELTDEDKQQLLVLARRTIRYATANRRLPDISQLGVTVSDTMKIPRAAFVTLRKNSQLRGCIGDIFPQRPLYKSVLINAINASFNDTRFQPLAETECNDVKIEISALTVPEFIASPNKIRLGVDGVVLYKNGRSALFLPQVAPEQGWDLEQMLTNLSLKAGLPTDAWKEGASFQVFQAVVFGE